MKITCENCKHEYESNNHLEEGYSNITKCPKCQTKNSHI